MFKLLVIIVVVINDVMGNLSPEEARIDEISSKLFGTLGDPKHPFPSEDIPKLKEQCNNPKSTKHGDPKKEMEAVDKVYKGIALKAVRETLSGMEKENSLVCQTMKGDLDLAHAEKLKKVFEKYILDAEKVRLGLLTVLHEQFNSGSKSTIPLLTCYIKQFIEKMLAVYQEKEVKDLVKNVLDNVLGKVVAVLEKEKGKAVDSCTLRTGTSNPSPFHAFNIAIMRAISNVQDN